MGVVAPSSAIGQTAHEQNACLHWRRENRCRSARHLHDRRDPLNDFARSQWADNKDNRFCIFILHLGTGDEDVSLLLQLTNRSIEHSISFVGNGVAL